MRTPRLAAIAALALVACSAIADADTGIDGGAGADAPVTLIATPADGTAAAAADLASLVSAVRVSEPLFDDGEARALRGLGEPVLAESTKLTLPSKTQAEALKARAKGLLVKIEDNASAMGLDTGAAKLSLPDLSQRQWGLKNIGLSQPVTLDDIHSLEIPGSAGEDIGVAAAPAENPDPSKKIVVAVLDTGVDVNHPNLKDRILTKKSECDALAAYNACLKTGKPADCDAQYAKTDTDGNGYPLDCTGWDATAGKNKVTNIFGSPVMGDTIGHGTHVAGIIGASASAGGAAGVASNVAILPVKVIRSGVSGPVQPQSVDASGGGALPAVPNPDESSLHWATGFADIIARGMLYAIRSGAQIINMSLGWPAGVDSEVMRRMTALAESRGVLVVVAAGNDSSDSRELPCIYPGVICVASHGPDGSLSHFSNYGAFVDVAAPGLGIISTWPTALRPTLYTAFNGYDIKDGTSMASPFVAGLLARLLNAGYSPREAYARLMAGARPTASPSYENAPVQEKFLAGGNADLAAAMKVAPRPLILPAGKDVLHVSWDLKAVELPLSASLRNFWTAATAVHVHATIRTSVDKPNDPSSDAHLTVSDWDFNGWAPDEIKTLATAIHIDRGSLDGRELLELTITADGGAPRVARIPVDVSVPVGPAFADEGAEVMPIANNTFAPNEIVRSVTALDGKPGQDYVAIDVGPDQATFHLLVEDGAGYREAAWAKTPLVNGQLLLIQRIDFHQNGQATYAFIYRVGTQFLFQFFEAASMNLTLQFSYDNGLAPLPPNFQWMRISTASGELLMPAWIAIGPAPDSELPKNDPWNPTPNNPRKRRLYYIALDGTHTVKAPDKLTFAQLLAQPGGAAGSLRALLAGGKDYELSYSVADVTKGACGPTTALTLDEYRNLAGVPTILLSTPVDPKNFAPGTVFAGVGTRGSQRMTTLGATGPVAADFTMQAPSLTDSVVQVAGVYLGASTKAAFAQTHYDIEFLDALTGRTARTGLDRFSFLPSFLTGGTTFPVSVASAQAPGGDRIPGVLVPASLGISDGNEVVVPTYDSSRRLERLSRPAELRFVAAQGCQALGNPVPENATAATKLAFFCGDRIIRIPLAY